MIHDYYLSKAERHVDTQIAKNKKEILDNVINDRKPKGPKDIHNFYPKAEDLKYLPKNSALLKISFTLKKPYTSKDEGEFHIIEEDFLFRWRDKRKIKKELNRKYELRLDEEDIKIWDDRIEFRTGKIVKENEFATVFINDKTVDILIVKKEEGEVKVYSSRIFENPIVRDKFTGLPMVRPSTWKGHLRFAARMVEWDKGNKDKIIRRLFGNESGDDNVLKGRLYFFPTFFKEKARRDVITPLKRDTRTPARGPISIEVMKSGVKGEFYLLYIPYPREKEFKKEEIKEDLRFLAEALKLMFYTYGFSAKKTSGFGVIERLKEDDVDVHPEDKRDIFSILYTKVNNNVNYGA
ncbi:hypothetical protein DRQ26_00570 [bacterium]|nr:MAG: hypothetical protein DRQ26_00570 [bacterium]